MKKSIKRIASIVIMMILLLNSLPVLTYAVDTDVAPLLLTVSSSTASPGNTVDITIEISNNPGIASLMFNVAYDSVLTLENVTFNSAFGPYATTPPTYTNPQKLTLLSPLQDVMTNGVLATMTFSVSEEAAEGYVANINITFDENNIFNSNDDIVDTEVVNGSVTVFRGIPGDIDADRAVTTKDAILLFRYVAGWDVIVDPDALNVDGDNSIGPKDAITLFRFIAGWDVKVFYGPICMHELTAVSANSASCEEDGNIAHWYCNICKYYYSNENKTDRLLPSDITVDSHGHTEATIDPVAPTYTTPGSTEGVYCSVCQEVLVEPEEIPVLEATEHNITFNDPKGTNKIISYNEQVGITYENMPRPELTGYKFLGWYTASNSGELVDYIPAGSTTDFVLFAHWEANEYSISFSYAPSHTEPLKYTVEDEIVIPNPEWTGLIFAGWTDPSGKIITGTDAYGNYIAKIAKGTTENFELTATWMSKQNKVTPINDNKLAIEYNEKSECYYFMYRIGLIENVVLDEIMSSEKKELGEEITITITDSNTISEDVAKTITSIVAKSILDQNTMKEAISINESLQTTTDTETNVGIQVGTPTEGNKIINVQGHLDFTFGYSESVTNGWESDMETTTLTETELETSESITNSLGYSNQLSTSQGLTRTISKEMPEGTYTYVHAGDIEVFAVLVFDPNTRTFTYTTLSALKRQYNTVLYYPEGYNITESLTKCDPIVFSMPTEAIEDKITEAYYVQYDANSGEGKMPLQLLVNGVESNLSANTFTKAGYIFNGWEYRTETGFTIYADKDKVIDLAPKGHTVTLYATWTPGNYNVKYDPNGGTGEMADSIFTYDKEGTLSEGTFERDGYTLIGWSTDPNAAEPEYADKDVIFNISADNDTTVTLYAVWQANTYTVTLNANGGTVSAPSVTVTFDQLYGALPTPTRSGYHFIGWTLNSSSIDKNSKMTTAYDHTLTAKWTKTYMEIKYNTSNGHRDITIESAHTDYVYPGFDIAALKTAGYKSLHVTVTYDARQIYWGTQYYTVTSSSHTIRAKTKIENLSGTDWHTNRTITFSIDLNNTNANGDFQIKWEAGGGNDDWILGTTTFKIEAKK